MSGMSKNDLKSFMKQTLAKTKEAGNSGMVVVGGSNGYKRVNHFQPKKKETKKEQKRSKS